MDILLVDDHPLMRAGLQCLLDATDDLHVVGAVGTAAESVATAAALEPDVVLMDVCLPGANGIEATRLLHTLEHPPCVVFLSTSCVPALVQEAFEAGATGYLVKDMSPPRLLAALRGLTAGQPPIDPRVARIRARLARRAKASGSGPRSSGHVP